jgi:hypothetical protein
MDATLDGFLRATELTHGVALPALSPGTVLDVHTVNSHYRMVVLDGSDRRVLISGGSVFPEATDVKVSGATAGGSAVRIGWISEGLRLELFTDLGPVTTSPVTSIEVEEEEPRIH